MTALMALSNFVYSRRHRCVTFPRPLAAMPDNVSDDNQTGDIQWKQSKSKSKQSGNRLTR